MTKSHKIILVIAISCAFSMGYSQDTFLDQFTLPFYNQNNGTLNFSTNWTENGEGTSPTGGRIQITGGQLRFMDMDNIQIQRSLDLSATTSATLTLDYTEINGDESISVQLWDGTSFNSVATLNGSGSVNHTLTAAERNAAATIRFVSASGGWGAGEEYRVDNVLFTATTEPAVVITDVTVNEGVGTATFTATHVGVNTFVPFTVNYVTNSVTATDGLDFNTVSGTLIFTGFIGASQTITVNILDDPLYECMVEDFFEGCIARREKKTKNG